MFGWSDWRHHLASLAVLFLLAGVTSPVIIGCTDEPTRSTPISGPEPADALKRTFSAHASRLLHGSEPFAASDARFAVPLSGDGTVLVMGGYGATGYLESTELYDPAQGTWSAARESATEPRNLHPMGGVS